MLQRMAARQTTLILEDENATRRFATALAQGLSPGDTVLLLGEIGAGKSVLARAVIQALQELPEDVPSPTFTIVQTYDTLKGELWHCDLYRVDSAADLVELGLADAFGTAICLVEWADRLGDLAPMTALSVAMAPVDAEPERRDLRLSWTDPRWDAAIAALTGSAVS